MIEIRLQMQEYGWADLHIRCAGFKERIYLSDVFDPFPRLIAWGQALDEGRLPARLSINEEGVLSHFDALPDTQAHQLLLRLTRIYGHRETQWEVMLCRKTLAATLKAELQRFFAHEFDPLHWDMRHDEDSLAEYAENGYIPLAERVRQNAWL